MPRGKLDYQVTYEDGYTVEEWKDSHGHKHTVITEDSIDFSDDDESMDDELFDMAMSDGTD